MPERAQVARYGNAMSMVFKFARLLVRNVHMHAVLQKKITKSDKNDLSHTANSPADPKIKYSTDRMLHPPKTIEAKARASQVLRAHCCVPACHSTDTYAIVGPEGTPIAGLSMYHPVDVFACSPPTLVAPTWSGARDLDHRLQTSCETPVNVSRHEFKVETKNKRLRVIITAFNKYEKQVGNPQKYFFNFKSNGLVS